MSTQDRGLSSNAQQRASITRMNSSSIRRNSQESNSTYNEPINIHAGSDNVFTKFTDVAFKVVSQTGKIAGKTMQVAGGVVTSTADAVGLKGQVLAAENIARKLATKSRNETNKTLNKARRLASRAMEFDEDSANSYDYDLLLAAAGAVEKHVKVLASHSPTFVVPPNQALVWKARVKKLDITFSVKEVREGMEPFILEPATKCTADMPIQGRIAPVSDRPRSIVLHFDNAYSAALQGKIIVYWVAVGENVSLADDQVGAARSKEMTAAEEGPVFP